MIHISGKNTDENSPKVFLITLFPMGVKTLAKNGLDFYKIAKDGLELAAVADIDEAQYFFENNPEVTKPNLNRDKDLIMFKSYLLGEIQRVRTTMAGSAQ